MFFLWDFTIKHYGMGITALKRQKIVRHNHTWNSILMKECTLIWKNSSGHKLFYINFINRGESNIDDDQVHQLIQIIINDWSRIFSFPDILCTLLFKAMHFVWAHALEYHKDVNWQSWYLTHGRVRLCCWESLQIIEVYFDPNWLEHLGAVWLEQFDTKRMIWFWLY